MISGDSVADNSCHWSETIVSTASLLATTTAPSATAKAAHRATTKGVGIDWRK